jgi:predicted DNA-binding transcriptional regulator AlpA
MKLEEVLRLEIRTMVELEVSEKLAVSALLDRESLAVFCGVSTRTIDHWRVDGLLPAPVQIGRVGGERSVIRWDRRDILRWIDERKAVTR